MPSPAAPSARVLAPSQSGQGTVTRGLILQLLAVAGFAVMGVLIKLLEDRYATSQVVLFRCWPALAVLLLYLPTQGGWSALKTHNPLWQLVRTGTGLTAMYVGFIALTRMEFADYVAISFTAPLFATLLAIPLLGEKVGAWRLGAVGLGFSGAMVILQPDAGGMDPIALIAVVSAVAYAFSMIAMRKVGVTDKSSATVFYFTLTGTIVALATMPGQWVTPGWIDLAMLTGIGVIGGVSQILLTQAYRMASPSTLAPFDYSAMLWAVLFGFLIFGTLPGINVLFGAALICASGLYIIHRERVRGVNRGKIKGSSL